MSNRIGQTPAPAVFETLHEAFLHTRTTVQADVIEVDQFGDFHVHQPAADTEGALLRGLRAPPAAAIQRGVSTPPVKASIAVTADNQVFILNQGGQAAYKGSLDQVIAMQLGLWDDEHIISDVLALSLTSQGARAVDGFSVRGAVSELADEHFNELRSALAELGYTEAQIGTCIEFYKHLAGHQVYRAGQLKAEGFPALVAHERAHEFWDRFIEPHEPIRSLFARGYHELLTRQGPAADDLRITLGQNNVDSVEHLFVYLLDHDIQRGLGVARQANQAERIPPIDTLFPGEGWAELRSAFARFSAHVVVPELTAISGQAPEAIAPLDARQRQRMLGDLAADWYHVRAVRNRELVQIPGGRDVLAPYQKALSEALAGGVPLAAVNHPSVRGGLGVPAALTGGLTTAQIALLEAVNQTNKSFVEFFMNDVAQAAHRGDRHAQRMLSTMQRQNAVALMLAALTEAAPPTTRDGLALLYTLAYTRPDLDVFIVRKLAQTIADPDLATNKARADDLVRELEMNLGEPELAEMVAPALGVESPRAARLRMVEMLRALDDRPEPNGEPPPMPLPPTED